MHSSLLDNLSVEQYNSLYFNEQRYHSFVFFAIPKCRYFVVDTYL